MIVMGMLVLWKTYFGHVSEAAADVYNAVVVRADADVVAAAPAHRPNVVDVVCDLLEGGAHLVFMK